MKSINMFFLSALLMINLFAYAGGDKPYLSATYSEFVTAEVISINQESREVTLRDAEGEKFSFVASEDVRNLKQVKPGDLVVAEYIQDISISVIPAAEAARKELVTAARAAPGEKPAGGVVDTQIEVAEVVAIDLDTNTFKLKDVDGVVTQYLARDPNNLRASAIGDMVETVVTHAVAISVEKKQK